MIRAEEAFKFPILAEKSVSISVKISSFFFLFFLEITCFWAEKPFQFPISAEKSVSISVKPFESDSKAMKIRVKVVYSCLTLSNPPLLSKSWLRACFITLQFVTARKFSFEIKKVEPKFFEEFLRTFLGCVLKRVRT